MNLTHDRYMAVLRDVEGLLSQRPPAKESLRQVVDAQLERLLILIETYEAKQTYVGRFRANPYQVRVAIRPQGKFWTVTISSRAAKYDTVFTRTDKSPRKALMSALWAARNDLPGIDTDCDFAYDHPQH